jgi:hypothetical protein
MEDDSCPKNLGQFLLQGLRGFIPRDPPNLGPVRLQHQHRGKSFDSVVLQELRLLVAIDLHRDKFIVENLGHRVPGKNLQVQPFTPPAPVRVDVHKDGPILGFRLFESRLETGGPLDFVRFLNRLGGQRHPESQDQGQG